MSQLVESSKHCMRPRTAPQSSGEVWSATVEVAGRNATLTDWQTSTPGASKCSVLPSRLIKKKIVFNVFTFSLNHSVNIYLASTVYLGLGGQLWTAPQTAWWSVWGLGLS